MKCAICGKETNWDESYGYNEFIVCPRCFSNIRKSYTTKNPAKELAESMKAIFAKRKAKKLSKNSWQITFNLIYFNQKER